MSLSDEKQEIECPNCSANIEVRLGDIRPGNGTTCACGQEIIFGGEDVAAQVAALDDALSDLKFEIKV